MCCAALWREAPSAGSPRWVTSVVFKQSLNKGLGVASSSRCLPAPAVEVALGARSPGAAAPRCWLPSHIPRAAWLAAGRAASLTLAPADPFTRSKIFGQGSAAGAQPFNTLVARRGGGTLRKTVVRK